MMHQQQQTSTSNATHSRPASRWQTGTPSTPTTSQAAFSSSKPSKPSKPSRTSRTSKRTHLQYAKSPSLAVWVLAALTLASLGLVGCPSPGRQVRTGRQDKTDRLGITSPQDRSSRQSYPPPNVIPLPIWSQLTTYERRITEDARVSSPSTTTLLELALIFSGPRTQPQAQPLHRVYRRFLAKVGPSLRRIKDPIQRAKALLLQFHTQLLGTRLRPYTTRYKSKQSRIDLLLKGGTFNCLSSSIVYGILAQELGLQVQIALMPTHAFTEIKAPQSDIWHPVETTSPHGFDARHDAAYYAGKQQEWAQAHGLRPATYVEYKRRELRSLRHVICRLALWKHLLKAWPQQADQRRLREVAGLLDGYVNIQGNRLATWINIYLGMRKAQQFRRSYKLFQVIGGDLQKLAQRTDWPPRSKHYIALLYTYWLEAAWRTQQSQQWNGLCKRLPPLLAALSQQQGGAAKHLRWLLEHILHQYGSQGQQALGEQWLVRARQLSPQLMYSYHGVFWNQLGNHWLAKEQWERAKQAYRKCLQETRTRPDITCKANLDVATHNAGNFEQIRAARHAQAGHYTQAIPAYRSCIKRLPSGHPIAKACFHGMAVSYYNHAARLLQKTQSPPSNPAAGHDFGGVVSAFRACLQHVSRHPIAKDCQRGLASTLYNWAVAFYRKGQRSAARQQLQACMRLPHPLPQCQRLYQQIKP